MPNVLTDYAHRFFGYLIGKPPEPVPTAAEPLAASLETLESRLSVVLHKLQQQTQEEEAARSVLFQPVSLAEQTAARLVARNAARDQMRRDIVALHGQLATGLSDADLETIREALKAHPRPPADPLAGLDRIIDRRVYKRLLHHAADLGWGRLVDRMQETGVSWPPYPELTHLRAEEEAIKFLEHHHQEVKAGLHHATAEDIREAMIGEVPAWSDFYPTPGERVWIETTMVGVAAGLQAQIYGATLTFWVSRPPELQAAVVAALEQLLSKLGEEQDKADPDVLYHSILKVSDDYIPDLVWSYAQPRLVWTATPEQPRTVVDLVLDLKGHEARPVEATEADGSDGSAAQNKATV